MGIFKRSGSQSAVSQPGAADALFTPVQQRVLGVLFGNPERRFTAKDIIALADMGAGPVQRELARLEASQLVLVRRISDVRHYQANTHSSVYAEVRALVVKTFGVTDIIRVALGTEASRIRAAFLFGTLPRQPDATTADLDLLVISDSLAHADLLAALDHAARTLGRKINATVFSPRELTRRVREKNVFVTRALSQPRIWLMGAHGRIAK